MTRSSLKPEDPRESTIGLLRQLVEMGRSMLSRQERADDEPGGSDDTSQQINEELNQNVELLITELKTSNTMLEDLGEKQEETTRELTRLTSQISRDRAGRPVS